VVEEGTLAVHAAGVAGQRAVGADDPVARHDDRHGVAADCVAGRPGGTGHPGSFGDVPVRHGLAERDAAEHLPDPALEVRPHELELEVERGAVAGKPLAELADGFLERVPAGDSCVQVGAVAVLLEVDAVELLAVADEQQVAEGARHRSGHHHGRFLSLWFREGVAAGGPRDAQRWCRAYERQGFQRVPTASASRGSPEVPSRSRARRTPRSVGMNTSGSPRPRSWA
jgi:hypothetical protein